MTDCESLQPGDFIAERYQVQRLLGLGGMGAVYLAEDLELNRQQVAIKLLHPSLSKDSITFERFRNEVIIARALSHPGIVRLFDLGKDDEGAYYISMEYVKGSPLDKRLVERKEASPEKTGGLEFEEALELLIKVLSALSHAHSKGVIHRDLKPGNIIIDSSGSPRILDFGIARLIDQGLNLTVSGEILGTPYYMSPEQCRGQSLDERSDLYTVGIIAYELVSGVRPFTGDSAVAVIYQHLEDDIPEFPEHSQSTIPNWFRDFILLAAKKDPAERSQSAAEMLKALEAGKKDVQTAGTDAASQTAKQKPQTAWKVYSAVFLLFTALLFAAFFTRSSSTADKQNLPPAGNMPMAVKSPSPAPSPPSMPSMPPSASPTPTPSASPSPTPLPSEAQSSGEQNSLEEQSLQTEPPGSTPIKEEKEERNTAAKSKEESSPKAAAARASLYILRSGQGTPSRVFKRSESGALRWLAAFPAGHSSYELAKTDKCFIKASAAAGEELSFPGRLKSAGSKNNPELRIGGDLTSLADWPFPETATLALICGSEVILRQEIRVAP